MMGIYTITKREFKAYFLSPLAYVYLITFLVIVNWLFFRGLFVMGETEVRSMFGLMPWIFLFFVPAVAMGKWAEERKMGTLEILFTLPIKDRDIVFAKFLASLGLIIVAILFTTPIPLTVSLLGQLDWGPVIGGYVGLILLGASYLSICLFLSSITESQIIAFILGVVISFGMFIIGTPIISTGSGILGNFLQYFGLGWHFDSIARGVIDSADIIYYITVITFFLMLNLKALETKARK
ncbi:MAG: ABC transporter permease [Pseudomonadota bacterium]